MVGAVLRDAGLRLDQIDAIAATAGHIRDFWDPRMKAAIVAGDRAGLSPIAAAAVGRLAQL